MKKLFFFLFFSGLINCLEAQNVGIGTVTPSKPLTVRSSGIGIQQESTDGTTGIGFYTAPGNAFLQTHTKHNLNFATNNGAGSMVLDTLGNLRIGDISKPGARLDVVGKIRIQDGNQALNRVLTSDANGLATWQPDAGLVLPYSGTYSGAVLNTFSITSTTANSTAGNFQNTATSGTANALFATAIGGASAFTSAVYGNISGSGYGYAVRGVANGTSSYGVEGETQSGYGVGGFASAAGGTAGIFLGQSGATALKTDGPIQIIDNGEGSGKVLTSDGAGNATWQNPGLALPYYISTAAGTAHDGLFTIESTGNETVAAFEINNILNSSYAFTVSTNGTGNAIRANQTGGSGDCGFFSVSNTSNSNAALQCSTIGTGAALKAVSLNASGNTAVFQNNNGNVARIDHNGKGFFNGGTQNSGADLAEAFATEQNTGTYEPGDVLAISTVSDRTVTKSNTAYSKLVVGVYATKPGVLLTEKNIKEDISGLVPMGVVGVIPTKVCNEGGAIHRGDILVTSSKSGYAMKADDNKIKPGMMIGKALADFAGDTGLINVLVNVR